MSRYLRRVARSCIGYVAAVFKVGNGKYVYDLEYLPGFIPCLQTWLVSRYLVVTVEEFHAMWDAVSLLIPGDHTNLDDHWDDLVYSGC